MHSELSMFVNTFHDPPIQTSLVFPKYIDISMLPKITFHTINNSANLCDISKLTALLPKSISKLFTAITSPCINVKHPIAITTRILCHVRKTLHAICQLALDPLDSNFQTVFPCWILQQHHRHKDSNNTHKHKLYIYL